MDGKVVVITGASGALGKVVAEVALARGAKVAGVDHAPSQLPATENRIELGGVDLSDAAAAKKAVDTVLAHFGRLDALVNIAGGFAFETVAEGGECRRVLVKELGQALAKTLPASYRGIVKDFSTRGFRQVDLTVRPSTSPGGGRGGVGGSAGGSAGANAAAAPGFEAMRDLWEKSMMGRMPVGAAADAARAWEISVRNPQGVGFGGAPGGVVMANTATLFERLMQDALAGATWPGTVVQPDGTVVNGGAGAGGAGGGGVSDADLMRLLRRLNNAASPEPGQDAGSETRHTPMGTEPTFFGSTFASVGVGAGQSMFGGSTPTNLIRAHHDELVQASTGEVDHMVIEVVASLFDQILADSRVPPEIAREIARLQMPVLRVALRDTSFFSSRKHAVRRFINRISTLASSFGQFESGPGRDLLSRVNALVTEIIEGDFDQVPLYVRKLGELEDFVAAASRAEFESSPAAATLQAKEAQWQMHPSASNHSPIYYLVPRVRCSASASLSGCRL